jgi:hypothetical protein
VEDNQAVGLHEACNSRRVTQLRVLAPATAVFMRPVSSSTQLTQPFRTEVVQGGAVSAGLLVLAEIAALV